MSELKKKRAEQVQNALDTTLSGIQDDPWLAQHVIHGIQKRKKEAKKIVKKIKKIYFGAQTKFCMEFYLAKSV